MCPNSGQVRSLKFSQQHQTFVQVHDGRTKYRSVRQCYSLRQRRRTGEPIGFGDKKGRGTPRDGERDGWTIWEGFIAPQDVLHQVLTALPVESRNVNGADVIHR